MTVRRPDGGRFTKAIRVGFLAPYFSFFDQRFPADYRPSQLAYAEGLAGSLAEAGMEVSFSGLVDSFESADAARRQFHDAAIDVVVVGATMAAPPAFGFAALEGFDGPIVVWDDRRVDRFDSSLDEVEATRASSLLGSIMLSSVLRRRGRSFVTISTRAGDHAAIIRAVRGAAAAAALRGARLGVLGNPLPGYDDVVLDPPAAARLDIDLVPVEDDLIARARRTAERAARAGGDSPDPFGAGLSRLSVAPGAQPLLDRSARVHRFLDAIVQEADVDALTINCHSDLLRWSDDYGIVGCLGASLLTNVGVPVSCTGDAATGVALMLGARLAGSAQYCEGYAIEAETGELLLSSCGMADIGLAGPTEATVVPNDLYPGKHGLGCGVRFGFPAGPATIIAVGPQGSDRRPRLAFGTGELTGRWFGHLNGPSGTLALDAPGAGVATNRWIDAGVAHHVALVRGDQSMELQVAAQFMDLELVPINPPPMGLPLQAE